MRNEKIYWAVIAILVLLLIAVMVWASGEKSSAQAALQQREAALQEQARSERAALAQEWEQRLQKEVAAARDKTDAETAQVLRVAAVPLSWAVRGEIQARNQGRVRNYFNDLIGYPGVRDIELIDATGKVLVATDRGKEGLPLDERYPADVQAVDKPSVFPLGGDRFVLSVPIFGMSAREGTVLLTYDRSIAAASPVTEAPAAPSAGTANPGAPGTAPDAAAQPAAPGGAPAPGAPAPGASAPGASAPGPSTPPAAPVRESGTERAR